jgi:hypothetical protein
MPNTLAHVGFQGLTTRALLRGADFKWIYVGCILPDLPWIFQRFVRAVFSGVDPYDLRLYVIVQSSLFFCLLLSFALATLSAHFWRTFAILGINSFLHLLLDAFQTKWANGVHFLAPFNWQLTNFGLFWPESFITYLFTGFGLAYFVWSWRVSVKIPLDLKWQPAIRGLALFALLTAYFATPLMLLDGPEKANNHFVKTFRTQKGRTGSYVEIDRVAYDDNASGGVIHTFAQEELNVDGMPLNSSSAVSVRGTFITQDRIRVKEYHVHAHLIRDSGSYLGLTLVALLWIDAVRRRKA